MQTENFISFLYPQNHCENSKNSVLRWYFGYRFGFPKLDVLKTILRVGIVFEVAMSIEQAGSFETDD